MLFAVGGYDGASRQCLSSVECYNPMTDMWSPVAEMSCRRSGAGTYPASLLTSTFYEQFFPFLKPLVKLATKHICIKKRI